MKFIGFPLTRGFAIIDENGIQAESKDFRERADKTTKDERSEWHAIEHKLINLLISGQEITLENLSNASMMSEECGVNNEYLKDPGVTKLKEGVRVGLEYLRLKNLSDSKNCSSKNFSSQ